jgi:hypothetical protein
MPAMLGECRRDTKDLTKGFRRTAEKRNKMVRWPISPREKSTKLAPFRIIAPLSETLTASLATGSTFATPGPGETYCLAWSIGSTGILITEQRIPRFPRIE